MYFKVVHVKAFSVFKMYYAHFPNLTRVFRKILKSCQFWREINQECPEDIP